MEQYPEPEPYPPGADLEAYRTIIRFLSGDKSHI